MSRFRVVEHLVPTQHIRHWPGATEPGHEDKLKLAVKQYIPLNAEATSKSKNQGDNAVTIIGAHANGFPKELYEPLWDDLYDRMTTSGQSIRSIWIADLVNQGVSGVENEKSLGDDPCWWDHARDLLFLINQKQDEMPQPLIGIGHSVGGMQLAHLSLIHPRLLQGLVMMDPVIQTHNVSSGFAPLSTYRRDLWPSRAEAETKFRASKFYQTWDSRVLEKWLDYGIRELPTEIYPDISAVSKNSEHSVNDAKPVTLTTTKVNELHLYARPKYRGTKDVAFAEDHDVYADLHPDDIDPANPFYRPEPAWMFRRLDELKPSILYIFGSKSVMGQPPGSTAKVERTGSGLGGSGGVKKGRVSEVTLDTGHLVAMEKPTETADNIAGFVVKEVKRWRDQQDAFEAKWKERSREEKIVVDQDWKDNMEVMKNLQGTEKKKKSAKIGSAKL